MALDFDNYFSTGYTDAGYTVRAEDTLYVEADYAETGYFAAVFSGISDLSSSFSISAAGDFGSSSASLSIAAGLTCSALDQDRASATISMAMSSSTSANITRSTSATLQIGGDRAWDDMNTWDAPAQDTWRRRVDIVGQRRVAASSSVSTQLTTSTLANRTRSDSSSLSTALTTSTVANRTRPGSSSASITLTSSQAGVVAKAGVVAASITFSSSQSAISRVTGSSSLSLATTTVSAAGRLRGAIALDGGVFGISATPNRTRDHSSSLNTALTTTTTALRRRPGATNLNISVSVSADMTRQRDGVNLSLGVFGVSTNGGKLLGIADEILPISAEIDRMVGTKITVDPFTTIRVEGESRIATVSGETRFITPKAETRINTINQETRKIRVYGESRILDTV